MNIIDILVPDLPESVTDAVVSNWRKKPGEYVKSGEILVDLETDKVVLEVPSPNSGKIIEIFQKNSSIVVSKQKIASLNINNYDQKKEENKIKEINFSQKEHNYECSENNKEKETKHADDINLSPSIRRSILKHNLNKNDINKNFDIKNNIENELNENNYLTKEKEKNENNIKDSSAYEKSSPRENRIKMTRLRKCIAERLLYSKNTTASLTTFNEVNMKSIHDLRKSYGDIFEKLHGIRLGYMSFFVLAVVKGLKKFPEIHAYIDGDDIVYNNYFDINIAISTERGLVTPILRNVDKMNMSEIEKRIKNLAFLGKNGKLKVEDLQCGSFTITNGGIFGSMMSTPIINPPQSAILGIHAIKDRVISINKKISINPMTYLALSYDHRLIDGKESASFLSNIKDMLENPIRMLLDI
ncbi:sucB [Wigglesworthia glossinidia endosymbiont of Glossina brevipalpis]|uniref:Dihydrolipoyllysine-residue succinyltransferase n=1 Tax=Wigglesworthia glossinidia brevipalpis TaxID=36870 RepID=Q8D2D6_WIGBR|nr:sucB [Wigglesworthia glossinidia endosymbiont of Glossina brevipalpis]